MTATAEWLRRDDPRLKEIIDTILATGTEGEYLRTVSGVRALAQVERALTMSTIARVVVAATTLVVQPAGRFRFRLTVRPATAEEMVEAEVQRAAVPLPESSAADDDVCFGDDDFDDELDSERPVAETGDPNQEPPPVDTGHRLAAEELLSDAAAPRPPQLFVVDPDEIAEILTLEVEPQFASLRELIARSYSITLEEKRDIVASIPKFTAHQVEELHRILSEEQVKFAALNARHAERVASTAETRPEAAPDRRHRLNGRKSPMTTSITDGPWLQELRVPQGWNSWGEWLRGVWRDLLVSRVRGGSLDGDLAKKVAEHLLAALSSAPPASAAEAIEMSADIDAKFGVSAGAEVRDHLVSVRANQLRRSMTAAVDRRDWNALGHLLETFEAAALMSHEDFVAMMQPVDTVSEDVSLDDVSPEIRDRVRDAVALPLAARQRLAVALATSSPEDRERILQILARSSRLIEKAESLNYGLASEMRQEILEAWDRQIDAAEAEAHCRAQIAAINAVFGGTITTSGETREGASSLFPSVLYATMRRRVVGQEQALRKMSVALFEQHLRRSGVVSPARPKPSVILMAGPSGSGKTHITSIAAATLDLPFVHANGARLVQSGIVGTNLSDVLVMLKSSAKKEEDAAFGVVFIDEIDKLWVAGESSGQHYGEAVQNELLVLLEGEKVKLSQRDKDAGYFDTSHLMFVLGGAFDGIESIVEKRVGQVRAIGFGAVKNAAPTQLYASLNKDDLIEYGFSTQLLGRVSAIAVLDPLGPADIREILRRPEISPFTEHRHYFEACGDELVVDEDVFDFLAEHAAGSSLGARKLSETVTSLMTELKFATANRTRETVHLTRAYVESRLLG